MSHIVQIEVEIRDLAALKAAVKELDCEWMEGQKTYAWYGRFQGDAPPPTGFTVEELGKCSHAIKVPNERYEVGVVQKAGKWRLLFDAWNSVDYKKPNGIVQKFGPALGKLIQSYSVHKIMQEAKLKGFAIGRAVLPNGCIRMTIGGRL